MRDLDGEDRDVELRRQRGVAGPIVEILELGGQRLDLAARLGQLCLDLEDVADPDGLRGDPLEGDLAGTQVRDPRLEVDDLAGHLDGFGLLGDDLGGQAVEATQAVEGGLPLVGRDAVRDLGRGLLAVVARGRRSDVPAEPDDRVARDAQCVTNVT